MYYQIEVLNGVGGNRSDDNEDFDTVIRAAWSPEDVEEGIWNFWWGAGFSIGDQRVLEQRTLRIRPESKSGHLFFNAVLPKDTRYRRTRVGGFHGR